MVASPSPRGERLELGSHGLVTRPASVPHSLEESAILITIAVPLTHTDPTGLEAESEARR